MPPDVDELSGSEIEPDRPVEVAYNPRIPIETFDVVIIDECHRSIYGVWRQVIEYFDAFLVGLTATPAKQTFGFFNQNLVVEYGHAEAVADGVNVDFDVYRIRTKITEQGSTVEAGLVTKFRDRETRKTRLEKLDEDVVYDARQLDRDVVAVDQIRTVIRTFRDNLYKPLDEGGIFPGRTEVPKTLIFAKDDSHADDIVRICREEFGRGNDFAVKITYRTTGVKPEDLLNQFRNSFNPRIAVTVDMIATGTDVRPLECVMFMRMVRSRNFFEQMKGRGVRIIDPNDLQAVSADATAKTHFVIVDAVGVTEAEFNDTQPLERKKTESLKKLLDQVAAGVRDADVVSSIAGRLARLDRVISPEDRKQLADAADGVDLTDVVRLLTNAVDIDVAWERSGSRQRWRRPDRRAARRGPVGADREGQPGAGRTTGAAGEADRGPPQLHPGARRDLQGRDHRRRVLPRRHRPRPPDRRVVASVRRRAQGRHRRPPDPLLPPVRQAAHPEGDQGARRHHRPTAVQLDTRAALGRPTRRSTPAGSRARPEPCSPTSSRSCATPSNPTASSSPTRSPSSSASRTGSPNSARPAPTFTDDQLTWLTRIKDHLATSLTIAPDDFELEPFVSHGGYGRANATFNGRLAPLLDELTQELVA